MLREHPPSDNPYVMIVDDEPAILLVVKRLLDAKGIPARAFSSGALALQAAEQLQPELVLLDVRMPGMDGYEVCRRLRELPAFGDTPVLFVSALHETADVVRGFQSGGSDYVSKPIHAEELLARVHLHQALCRARRELELRNRELSEQCRRLRTLEQRRDEFVHMLVHDLRAPLQGVALVLEYLGAVSEPLPLQEQKSHLQAASLALRGVFRNLRTLLDVSRMEEGKMPFHPVPLDARHVVEEARIALGGLARDRDIRVEIDPPDTSLYGDRDLCIRILTNLLDNAIRHTPPDRQIRVGAAPDGDATRLWVSDNGPGISPEACRQVFDKFAVGEKRRTATASSCGMGLAFCKLAVQTHGGVIAVESEVGKGSTFWFTLPGSQGESHESGSDRR